MDLFNKGKIQKLATEIIQLKDTNAQIVESVRRNNLFQLSSSFVNQNIAIYPTWDVYKQADRYSGTDDIYSIIRLIATTSALIPMYVYSLKDDAAFKSIGNKSFDPAKFKKLHTKALTDLPASDKLNQLLESPHLFLSKFEFLEAIYTILGIHGECILYKIRSDFGVNAGLPVKLEFLESQNVVRHVSGFPHQITGYDYRENGILIMKDIPPEDIIHIRYFKGLSPLQALHRRLIRMDEEMNVSVAQLQNGGVPGIVYDQNDDGTTTVPTDDGGEATLAENRKTNFYKYLQNKANKGAPYMSSGKLGYIELGLKLADMDVAELSKIDFKKLCNAFGVSDVLFNNDAASTESNIEVQEKRLYTNTVLPNVYRVRDAFNNSLVPDFDPKQATRHVEVDLSDITVLHSDLAKKIAQYSNLPIMIPNQILEELGFPKIDNDPLMDKVYVKTGYVALEDLQGSGDLPLTPDFNKP